MDKDLHSLLAALGDGATREHAESAMNWMATREGRVVPSRIGGLSEVASRTGRTKQTVCNWIARGNFGFPQPIAELAATKLFDMDQIDDWCKGNPELVKSHD